MLRVLMVLANCQKIKVRDHMTSCKHIHVFEINIHTFNQLKIRENCKIK